MIEVTRYTLVKRGIETPNGPIIPEGLRWYLYDLGFPKDKEILFRLPEDRDSYIFYEKEID